MKKHLFSIGEMSKIKGISVKALRFYEKIGLIKPCIIDPWTRYRYYSLEQFIQLDIIKAARAMSISPKDIKTILDRKDSQVLLNFMEDQKKKAQEKIRELTRMMTVIDTAEDSIRQGLACAKAQDLRFRDIPERLIVCHPYREGMDEEALLLEYARINAFIEKNRLINTYETGIIYKPDDNLEFYPRQVFNTVLADESSKATLLANLPAGRYLCLCFNRQNAQEKLQMLNTYMAEHHLNPKVIVQVDVLNDVFDNENPLSEMQVMMGAP